MEPSEQELPELPLAALKDEIRQLEAFMRTQAYTDFVEDFKHQNNFFNDKVWDTVPQTIGEDKEREQFIGAAKWTKYAETWFDITLAALKSDLIKREAPQP